MANTHKHKNQAKAKLGDIISQKNVQKKKRKKITLPHQDPDFKNNKHFTGDWPGSRMPSRDHIPYQRQG